MHCIPLVIKMHFNSFQDHAEELDIHVTVVGQVYHHAESIHKMVLATVIFFAIHLMIAARIFSQLDVCVRKH